MNSKRLDPETLAAFLDGTLEAEERAEVIRLLAQSPLPGTPLDPNVVGALPPRADVIDSETLAEAATIRHELEREDFERLQVPAARIKNSPLARSRRLPWLIGFTIAASVTALLVVQRLSLQQNAAGTGSNDEQPRVAGPDRPGAVGSLALLSGAEWMNEARRTGLHPQLGREWSRVDWPISRGFTVAGTRAGFRSGVDLVLLEFALEIGDTLVAAEKAEDLRLQLSLPGGGPAAAQALAIARARGAASTDQRAALRSSVVELFDGSAWFALGTWIGQAWLARQDTAFFAPAARATTQLRTIYDRMAADPRLQQDPTAQAVLDELSAILRSRNAADARADSAYITRSLQSVLRLAGVPE